MKDLFIYFLFLIMILIGDEFGASLYYLIKTGQFQSSVLFFVITPYEEVSRGLFSSIFLCVAIILIKNKKKLYKKLAIFLILYFIAKIIAYSFYQGKLSISSITTIIGLKGIVLIAIIFVCTLFKTKRGV